MEREYLPGNVRERIQELLKERGITQAQLAARIGSTESAVSRFISGKTDKINAEHIIRIAKAFNVSTDFLLGVLTSPTGRTTTWRSWACPCRRHATSTQVGSTRRL